MQMSFRWYGDRDPVTLEQIRQIPGMEGIVTAIYDIPVGDVWPFEKIMALKEKVEAHGFIISVIESVPVHEDIKLGLDTRDHYIANYKQTIRNLAKASIQTICYNFMPVFDWTRTRLDAPLPDGSHSLSYEEDTIKEMDPLSGELTLPGWDLSFQTVELKRIMDRYQQMSEDTLMQHLVYFLEQVVPVAEEENVFLAIHPDDPPWSIFGLPRIITGPHAVKQVLAAVDSLHNGITFCSGSYGANPENDLQDILHIAKERIHFVHARNVRWTGEKSFQETSHLARDGSLDMTGIMKTLIHHGYKGPIRPDHGRMIWGEEGRPGYGLFDRALGAAYLNGIIDAVHKGGSQ
ncbi:mannonate dehydratase [Shouchella sp. 1P09AA]|uniref:mannonate dehydratase n=1 Tax=unclassified Shouchella TaxID=2893065 RepID=UPI0039A19383